jgi:transposase
MRGGAHSGGALPVFPLGRRVSPLGVTGGPSARCPHGCRSSSDSPDKWLQAHRVLHGPAALQNNLRGEVEGQMPRYFGLDVHKSYIHACELGADKAGNLQERHFRFPNCPRAWAQFTSGLGQDARVALEVTGSAFEIHDILAPHAGQVVVANPVAMRRLGGGRHTDRQDAARLARMLALGTLPAIWVPPLPVREVRRLLQVHERLGSYRRALLNQARAVLRRQGILLPKGPAGLRRLTEGMIERLPAAERAILVGALAAARALQEQEQAILDQIAARVAHEPGVRLLMTIPGVGLMIAATLWAKLGDPRRFPGPKQVGRYAGLDPSVDQSGERDRRGRISRNGDRLLRRALVEAAWVVARHDSGPLGTYYRRKAKQLGAKRALIAMARRLVVVAWRMLLTGEVYRGYREALVRRKQARLAQLLRRLPGESQLVAAPGALDGLPDHRGREVPAPAAS